jgi:hypothetical protein
MSNCNNFEIYSTEILLQIPDILEDDLKWLCNQSSDVYKECEELGGCTDNFRVSRFINDKVSSEYIRRQDCGCCGAIDKPVTNPLTSNTFIIGFNFGH